MCNEDISKVEGTNKESLMEVSGRCEVEHCLKKDFQTEAVA